MIVYKIYCESNKKGNKFFGDFKCHLKWEKRQQKNANKELINLEKKTYYYSFVLLFPRDATFTKDEKNTRARVQQFSI